MAEYNLNCSLKTFSMFLTICFFLSSQVWGMESNFKNDENLTINNKDLSNASFSTLPGVTYLDINSCTNIDLGILGSFPNLKSLRIGMTTEKFMNFSCEHKNLEKLYVFYTNIDLSKLNLPSLKYLNIEFMEFLDSNMKLFSLFKNLKKVKVFGCRNVNEELLKKNLPEDCECVFIDNNLVDEANLSHNNSYDCTDKKE